MTNWPKQRFEMILHNLERQNYGLAKEFAVMGLEEAPKDGPPTTGRIIKAKPLVVWEPESTIPMTPPSSHLRGDLIEAIFTHAALCLSCQDLLAPTLLSFKTRVLDVPGSRQPSTFQRQAQNESAESLQPAESRSPSSELSERQYMQYPPYKAEIPDPAQVECAHERLYRYQWDETILRLAWIADPTRAAVEWCLNCGSLSVNSAAWLSPARILALAVHGIEELP